MEGQGLTLTHDQGYVPRTTSDTVKDRASHVDTALSSLHEEVQSLEDAVNLLEQRVAPVMRPPEPSNEAKMPVERVILAPVAQVVTDAYERVGTLRARLYGIMERLEV